MHAPKVGSLEFHLHKAITRWPINPTRVVSEKQGLLSCQNCNKSLWCQWRPHGELELHVVMKRSSPCHCRCQLKLSGNLDFFLHLTEMKQCQLSPNLPEKFQRKKAAKTEGFITYSFITQQKNVQVLNSKITHHTKNQEVLKLNEKDNRCQCQDDRHVRIPDKVFKVAMIKMLKQAITFLKPMKMQKASVKN